MKAVAVAGGSPDTPKAPETEGTELPETQNTPPEHTPRPTTPTETEPGDAGRAGSKGGPRDEPAAETEPEPPTEAKADAARGPALAQGARRDPVAGGGLEAAAETQADTDAVRKAGRAEGASGAPVATTAAETEVAGAVGTGSDADDPAEAAARSEDESLADDAGSKAGTRGEPVTGAGSEADATAEADAVRHAGRAQGAPSPAVTADAGSEAATDAETEVEAAVGTGSDEEEPAEAAARSEDESLADDAQGAGSKVGTRGETVAGAGSGADATAEADAVRKAGRAEGASGAPVTTADARTEVAGAVGTGSDEDAPAGLAAKADAEADLEAEHVPEAAEAEAEAEPGDTAPAPGTAAAQGDVPTSGAKGTGGAVSDPAAAALGGEVPEGKEAATGGNAPASGAAAKTEDKGTGGDVSDPGTAAADGGVARSGAVVGGADASGSEVGGGDVSDDEVGGADASGPEVGGGDGHDAGAGGDGRDAGAATAHDEPSAEAGDGAGRVPSWARDDETDAERTSQFVALKDLDAPAEKAPWPRALAPNRTPGRKPAPTDAPTPTPGRTPTAGPTTTPTPAPNPSRAAGLAPGRAAGPRTPSAPAPAPTAAPAPAGSTPTAAPAPAGPAPAGLAPAGPTPVVEPTREVPVPPRPPLDLLAELTNNPPPPETPRRTAVRRVKIWTPILLLLAGAAIGGQLLRPLPAPRIVAAEQTHTLDGQFSVPWPAKGQGTVRVPGSGDIGAFGEQKPVPTASVAKVMTAYVILKNHPLRKAEAGPQIEVDAKAVADGTSDNESRIVGLVAGTKFSQQDMLKMLMIPSGNNVARLLARWDTGTDSEAAFVEKMNAAARELGMRNTTYTDPSGLDAATVSTAADQLKLAEAVMKDEAFRAVVALPSAEIKGLSDTLINNNTLLSVNGLSVRGIKTGSSTPAGGTLMWAAYKSVGDETPLILGTLMDQHADGPDRNGENSLKLVLANSKKIIESVRQALDSAPVVRKGQTVGHVDDGLGGRTPLVATKDLNVIGVPGQQLQLTLRPGASGTPHAAKAGTEVGVLTVGTGEGAKTVPVALGTNLAEPSFTTRVTRLR
ncbi:D-alanyl-D-alanine carboxypeptidase [Streptomyces vinaceus]|uniref:D-alanyl-D-alanine carboxypeptidase n=1 Tax=Streptomyces vinaceus TaxID=1960 RepID=UPI001983D570|nr:serine hydrolase [Streptomyces vinaceus]GHE43574.1 hypothetical protein GCM10017778_28870 [Streptomyces vinaceus]